MEEILPLITEFPKYAKKSNDGKGKAQYIILTPICLITKIINPHHLLQLQPYIQKWLRIC